MPITLPARFQAARKAGLSPAEMVCLLTTGLMQRHVERRIARTRASGDIAALEALMIRRVQLSERAAVLLGQAVPDGIYAELEALRVWIERDLRRMDRELRRLAWAEARKARAETAGNGRAAAKAQRLGQAACDRIAAFSRYGTR
jgi:hypothetical protein